MKQKTALRFEICILAGGLSSRMGRDKSRIRIGRRTLLGHIRAIAGELKLPIRVIRRDIVPRCGPLGGIYTALKSSRADAILFLACDMPFVTPAFLQQMLRAGVFACFAAHKKLRGLPCLLDCATALPIVTRQISKTEFSLQALARALKSKSLEPTRHPDHQLLNLNTPADLEAALAHLK